MRRTFRAILQTPANALQAMVDGLREQSKRPDFLVDMSTYGEASSDGAICYGCAATCAVQKATGINLTAKSIGYKAVQAVALDVASDDLRMFEAVINEARCGRLYQLFWYFRMTRLYRESYNNRWFLSDSNWEAQLPAVESFIAELKGQS